MSQSFEHLLGQQITLTLLPHPQDKNDRVISGKLWAYDQSIGSIALETQPKPLEPFLASSPASAAASQLSSRSRNIASNTSTTGFKIIKTSEVKKVEFSSASQAASSSSTAANGSSVSQAATSSITPLHAVSLPAAQAREANAVKQSRVKASKMGGKDVSELGQLVFDALSKTLPCRWHGPHIIVLEEVVISGPGYDPASTNVPNFTHEQLQSYIDGTNQGPTPDGAQAKANSWNRVSKVLEGERRKILSAK